MFGDQTDVPESGDWWDATYLMMWGSNVPVTRTPDAHWMAEVRYRGTKVVTVSPDYADNTKFADEWMPAQAGTDAALAMAMGHVLLKEFFVDRRTPFFVDYVRTYTDLPFLIRLDEHDGATASRAAACPASSSPPPTSLADGQAAPRTPGRRCCSTAATGQPVVPNGSMGFRYADSGMGRWNLDLDGVPARRSPSRGDGSEPVEVLLPAFVEADGTGSVLRRGVPARRVGGHLVTTVYDLMLAQYGVDRDGPARRVAERVRRRQRRPTPRPGRRRSPACRPSSASGSPASSPRNAEESGGRSMIIMGAGICQWFHGDATYRADPVAAHAHRVHGPQRRRLGALRRPGEVPPDHRLDLAGQRAGLESPAAHDDRHVVLVHAHRPVAQRRLLGRLADLAARAAATSAGMHTADTIAQSARLGWMPFYPQFTANPLDVADEATAAVDAGTRHRRGVVRGGRLAGRQPRRRRSTTSTRPENWPRTLVLWRSNLIGSSAKGNEYFLKNLLGTHSNVLGQPRTRRRRARARSRGTTRRPRASSTCWSPPTSG